MIHYSWVICYYCFRRNGSRNWRKRTIPRYTTAFLQARFFLRGRRIQPKRRIHRINDVACHKLPNYKRVCSRIPPPRRGPIDLPQERQDPALPWFSFLRRRARGVTGRLCCRNKTMDKAIECIRKRKQNIRLYKESSLRNQRYSR